ncbi:hypothetical protein GGTG_01714 [Gaeumannomyces tritici R3-111a-1]|uniref:Uncharacterized protein n=1 Tax=Gaeumannomyces tritici (strain R3-111a-1) TaxID=644352 RepID=J3NKD5_GAET3|nr:hypothetical protein GGTG_01714 [Gaeumannomyces tritici R3-111a-1]EJT81739.1 hypothetical protein GGTG_01714 [Gaeumannomyces tritici R3-111a-1]
MCLLSHGSSSRAIATRTQHALSASLVHPRTHPPARQRLTTWQPIRHRRVENAPRFLRTVPALACAFRLMSGNGGGHELMQQDRSACGRPITGPEATSK